MPCIAGCVWVLRRSGSQDAYQITASYWRRVWPCQVRCVCVCACMYVHKYITYHFFPLANTQHEFSGYVCIFTLVTWAGRCCIQVYPAVMHTYTHMNTYIHTFIHSFHMSRTSLHRAVPAVKRQFSKVHPNPFYKVCNIHDEVQHFSTVQNTCHLKSLWDTAQVHDTSDCHALLHLQFEPLDVKGPYHSVPVMLAATVCTQTCKHMHVIKVIKTVGTGSHRSAICAGSDAWEGPTHPGKHVYMPASSPVCMNIMNIFQAYICACISWPV